MSTFSFRFPVIYLSPFYFPKISHCLCFRVLLPVYKTAISYWNTREFPSPEFRVIPASRTHLHPRLHLRLHSAASLYCSPSLIQPAIPLLYFREISESRTISRTSLLSSEPSSHLHFVLAHVSNIQRLRESFLGFPLHWFGCGWFWFCPSSHSQVITIWMISYPFWEWMTGIGNCDYLLLLW